MFIRVATDLMNLGGTNHFWFIVCFCELIQNSQKKSTANLTNVAESIVEFDFAQTAVRVCCKKNEITVISEIKKARDQTSLNKTKKKTNYRTVWTIK